MISRQKARRIACGFAAEVLAKNSSELDWFGGQWKHDDVDVIVSEYNHIVTELKKKSQ